jgi:hypothetical protein
MQRNARAITAQFLGILVLIVAKTMRAMRNEGYGRKFTGIGLPPPTLAGIISSEPVQNVTKIHWRKGVAYPRHFQCLKAQLVPLVQLP